MVDREIARYFTEYAALSDSSIFYWVYWVCGIPRGQRRCVKPIHISQDSETPIIESNSEFHGLMKFSSFGSYGDLQLYSTV